MKLEADFEVDPNAVVFVNGFVACFVLEWCFVLLGGDVASVSGHIVVVTSLPSKVLTVTPFLGGRVEVRSIVFVVFDVAESPGRSVVVI